MEFYGNSHFRSLNIVFRIYNLQWLLFFVLVLTNVMRVQLRFISMNRFSHLEAESLYLQN